MPDTLSPPQLDAMRAHSGSFALLDVREAGEYNAAHIPDSSLVPRRQIEFRLQRLLPFTGTRVVLYDDDGRRAALAAATLERMGYTSVSVLEGGVNRWAASGYPTEWGMNVFSKDFGEGVSVRHRIPELTADELHQRQQSGEKLLIVDTRTPEEFRRASIPGGRSVPSAELPLRFYDILKGQEGATIVVNCAGRTRSIIGARTLQRMGFSNVYDLRNGTSGWVLAGLELESGSDRVALPDPSPEGLAVARRFAASIAAEDGVRYLSVDGLRAVMERADSETVHLIDVRTEEEYRQGHLPGFGWFAGGQAVQRTDEVVAVRDATIVFCCDDVVRATVTASWYRQMGLPNIFVLEGGATAWEAAGLSLEVGTPAEPPFGLAEAREAAPFIAPRSLQPRLEGPAPSATVIFVGLSRDFALGHVPGAHWVPRGWLEMRVDSVAPSTGAPVVVTSVGDEDAALSAATLRGLGYGDVRVLEGGMAAWKEARLPLETGLSGVMSPPVDLVPAGTDRSYADMVHYLRWEEALGEKHQAA
jgi:rhodanese-related sulfurtransferase